VEIKRGDVFLVDLNPVVGAEQAGRRPALVIQINKANAASPPSGSPAGFLTRPGRRSAGSVPPASSAGFFNPD